LPVSVRRALRDAREARERTASILRASFPTIIFLVAFFNALSFASAFRKLLLAQAGIVVADNPLSSTRAIHAGILAEKSVKLIKPREHR